MMRHPDGRTAVVPVRGNRDLLAGTVRGILGDRLHDPERVLRAALSSCGVAPEASSLVPSVNVVMVNDAGEIVILYTGNGEVRQECSIVLTARSLTGQPTPSSESSEVRWVPVSEVPGYTMEDESTDLAKLLARATGRGRGR